MKSIISYILEELETLHKMPMDEFNGMRDRRLAKIVAHHYRNSAPYRSLLNSNGIHENNLPTEVKDIGRLPVIGREWFEEVEIDKNPSLPKEKIRKCIETSGAYGKPLRVPWSYDSGRRLAGELFIRQIMILGVDVEKDKGYIVTHWIPGGKDVWAAHEFVTIYRELLGDVAIDESTRTPLPKHLEQIIESNAVYLGSGTPFYVPLANLVSKENLKDKIKLRRGFAGGASINDSDHDFAKKLLGLEKFLLIYSSTEACSIGMQTEEKGPYMIFGDEQIVEVVDDNLKQVKESETGRILITTLSMDSAPLIRYEQGDEVRFLGNKPPEEYNKFFPLVDSIRRFKDAKIGGGILPYSQIEKMSQYMREKGVAAIGTGIQIAKREKEGKDLPIIRIEALPGQDPEKVKQAAVYAFKINDQMDYLIEAGDICNPEVEIYNPGELTAGKFKIPLFVDETSI
jgi:phenylacetate-coenzyme A ligase PaaK-like adenylate-forming protein